MEERERKEKQMELATIITFGMFGLSMYLLGYMTEEERGEKR